ncbi:nitrate/nitrite transporter [Goodfellowiella coeruleoviolacea]|uniref:MFS transporter, NNP family, nitrate/nitrite transporter n=1 Tax=Goodfellowiella coeruleoviolacea TaxID=334858 RepID=A0AAE3KI19_9PSEU|nr:nitrate/nitrite transporter [Goodfellowiella coeruleoviolacea]MCP2168816.1 MFS transporter, NNP family, nitrate/nitrite transporter [Goodfellowiella coeruleoviolacea]
MSTAVAEEAGGGRAVARRGRWIEHWDPEDPEFWARTGARIARRNLVFSILAEHIGFSIWSLWSVMVLFMGPEYGLTAADKFLLVSTPTVVGAVLRLPYTLAVSRFGGRNWTVFSAALLLVPAALAALVIQPGTSLGTFVLVAAVAGVGGGNFASSMTNINMFFPEHRKGWALGLNAGGGNLGVAVVQLVGLLVLGTAGAATPRLVLWVYLPLIVVAALCSVFFMDNLATGRSDTRAMREVVRDPHCWVMSFLYIGTFGSFIGYGFAFGLVLQTQFGRTPLQAAALTFLGPLLGSVSRPLGGWLSDRLGGARVTLATFALMALGTVGAIVASSADSLAVFVACFVALFVFSGVGNGSTYKMIPAIFQDKAAAAVAAGQDRAEAVARARRLSGAVIGIAGAVGALGGLFINLAFRSSFATASSGVPAFVGFLVFYAVCFALTWAVYLRSAPAGTGAARLAGAGG